MKGRSLANWERPHMVVPQLLRDRSTTALALLVGLLVIVALSGNAFSQEIQLTVSSDSGDRLTAKPALRFQAEVSPQKQKFEIRDEVHYQKMDGFGASFLEAGLICINDLPPDQQEEVFRALFDPKSGAGFSAMKTVIASTDFMSAGPYYSYDPTPGDVDMKGFSIARDLGPNGQITYIKRARRYGSFVLQATMDFPPDWMMLLYPDIDPQYYGALSHYYLRYLQEYERNGVFIDYLSLLNEPIVYTRIPYTELNVLLRDYVGPLLEREKVRTRIMPSEAPTRENAARNYPILLADPVTRKYIAALPYHGYDLKNSERIAVLHEKYPQYPLWMTELCHGSLPVYAFADGDFWGNQIFDDLEASASAWIYWNMVLDENGGPWATDTAHGNPDNNHQHPVVVVDRQNRKVTYTGLYYYLTHFSKFVRPGAVRIQTVGNMPGVRVMSFASPDGRIVTEIMNSNKTMAEIELVFHAKTVHLSLPPVSITTGSWKNYPHPGEGSDTGAR
jgi:glucosylceramidase